MHYYRSAVLVLGLVCATVAQSLSDVPSPENFFRRFSASATVVRGYVYIDGGMISQKHDGLTPDRHYYEADVVNSTISIDLSKSWTTSRVALRTIQKPWASRYNQVLWTDHERGQFYSWGGALNVGRVLGDDENKLWKFTPDGEGGGTWATETISNQAAFQQREMTALGASANTKNTGFVIGGVVPLRQGSIYYQAVSRTTTFDLEAKTWEDRTTGFGPFDTLVGASAHYIPNIGPNGLIIVLGGIAPSPEGEINLPLARPFDLRNLTFFDPHTKQTYNQIATGSIPPSPRSQFCVTGFANTEGGYEIFLAGGMDFKAQIPYRDAYILSLPGFIWTKAPDSPAGERTRHTCVSVGQRQVLSIGGMMMLSVTDKDPAAQGLQLFDVTEMKWKDSYDANALAYQRAPAINAWYNNGVEWTSDEVRRLLLTAPPTDPLPSPSTPPSGDSTRDSISGVAAIAGGVVGGVAGIAILAAATWLLIRRRKKTASKLAAISDDPSGNDAPEVVTWNMVASKSRTRAELEGSQVERQELAAERPRAELEAGTVMLVPELYATQPPHA